MEYTTQISVAKLAARIAAKSIMEIYNSGDLGVEWKGVDDPVGKADKASNKELIEMLHSEFPDYGILSEESVSATEFGRLEKGVTKAMTEAASREYCWLLDPLDGTQHFIDRKDSWGINIGLTKEGRPVMGLNHYPALQTTYLASEGGPAYKITNGSWTIVDVSDRSFQDRFSKPIRLLAGTKGTDGRLMDFIEQNAPIEKVDAGSAGYKLSLLSEGVAELYLIFKPVLSKWDTCSGEVILKAAGGNITDAYGKPLDYTSMDKELWNKGIVASNGLIHEYILNKINTDD